MPDVDAFLQALDEADPSRNMRYGRTDQGDKSAARQEAAIPYTPEDTTGYVEKNASLRRAAEADRRPAEASSDPVERNPNLRRAALADRTPAPEDPYDRSGPVPNASLRDAGRGGRGVAVAAARAEAIPSDPYDRSGPLPNQGFRDAARGAEMRRASARENSQPDGDVTAAKITTGPIDTASVDPNREDRSTNSGDGGRDSLTARYGREDKTDALRAGASDREDGRRQSASLAEPDYRPVPKNEGTADADALSKQPKGKVTPKGKPAPKDAKVAKAAPKKGGPKVAYADAKGKGEEDLNAPPPAQAQGGTPGLLKLPDYGDNPSLDQRNAMNAQELGKQGRGGELSQFLSKDRTAQSVKAGLVDLNHMISGGQGAIPGASQPDPRQMQQVFSTGAMSPQEVEQLKDTVDPKRQLREDARLIAGMNASYEYYMNKGQPQKAAAIQRGILLHIRNVVSRGGYIAQAALEAGDHAGAAKAIASSYSMIPDGQTMKITSVGKDGTVGFALADDETGALTHQGQATVNQLMYVATGMQNGSLWYEQMSGVAQRQAAAGHRAQREAISDARYEAGQARADRAEQRADQRFTVQEEDRKRRNAYYDKKAAEGEAKNNAAMSWADHVTAINAIDRDIADAQKANDTETLGRLNEERKQALAAAGDFIKASPEGARYTQQFNTLSRPRYQAKPAGTTGRAPTINPDRDAAVDAAIAQGLGKDTLPEADRFPMRAGAIDMIKNNPGIVGPDHAATVIRDAIVTPDAKVQKTPDGNALITVNGQQYKVSMQTAAYIAAKRAKAPKPGPVTDAGKPTGLSRLVTGGPTPKTPLGFSSDNGDDLAIQQGRF
jgi:hypothetical protein